MVWRSERAKKSWRKGRPRDMCRWSFGYERSRNSGYRRLNKQRSVFPSDTALLKALYLATHKIAKKWTMPLRNWCRVLGELEIMYPDRLG